MALYNNPDYNHKNDFKNLAHEQSVSRAKKAGIKHPGSKSAHTLRQYDKAR